MSPAGPFRARPVNSFQFCLLELFSETDAHVNELVCEQVTCVGSGYFHTSGNHLVQHALDSGFLHVSNG